MPRPRWQVVTKDPGVDSAYIGLVPPQPGQPPVPPKVVDGTVLIQATTKAASDSQEAEDTVQRLRSDLDAVSTTRSSAATRQRTSTCTRRARAT